MLSMGALGDFLGSMTAGVATIADASGLAPTSVAGASSSNATVNQQISVSTTDSSGNAYEDVRRAMEEANRDTMAALAGGEA